MKLITFALIFVAIVLQSTFACDEADHNSDSDQGSDNYYDESVNDSPILRLFQRFGEIGSDFVLGFGRAGGQGLNAGALFAEILGNALNGFYNAAEEFGGAVAVSADGFFNDNVNNFVTTIRTLQQTINVILENSGGVQSDLLSKVENQLDSTASAAENLQVNIDNVHAKLSDNLEVNAVGLANSWDKWATSVLDDSFSALSNTNLRGYKRIESLVNDFVATYTGYLNQCIENIVGETENYDSTVQSVVDGYRSNVNALIREVQVCLRTSDLNCQRNVTIQLRTLYNAPREFSLLVEEGNQLVNSDFESRDCVSALLADYETERDDILTRVSSIRYSRG